MWSWKKQDKQVTTILSRLSISSGADWQATITLKKANRSNSCYLKNFLSKTIELENDGGSMINTCREKQFWWKAIVGTNLISQLQFHFCWGKNLGQVRAAFQQNVQVQTFQMNIKWSQSEKLSLRETFWNRCATLKVFRNSFFEIVSEFRNTRKTFCGKFKKQIIPVAQQDHCLAISLISCES